MSEHSEKTVSQGIITKLVINTIVLRVFLCKICEILLVLCFCSSQNWWKSTNIYRTEVFSPVRSSYALMSFCVTTITGANCFQSDPSKSKGKIFLCFLFSASLVAFSHCSCVLLPRWSCSWTPLLRGLCWTSENSHGPDKSASFLHPGSSCLEKTNMPKKYLFGAKEQIYTQTSRPGAFLEEGGIFKITAKLLE